MLTITTKQNRKITWFLGEPFNFDPSNIASIEANGEELEIIAAYCDVIPKETDWARKTLRFSSELKILEIHAEFEERFMRRKEVSYK